MTTALPKGWEEQILTRLGAPITPATVYDLDVWQRQEGGSTNDPDSYNPFNTTVKGPGSFGTNSVGVQAFPNWTEGLNATVQTIEQQNMAGILAALKGNDNPAPFEAAVSASPWGTHFHGVVQPPSSSSGVSALLNNPSLSTAGNTAGAAVTAVGSAAGNAFVSGIESLISNGTVMKGTLIVVGIIIAIIGLKQLFNGNASANPASTATQGAEDVKVSISKAKTDVQHGADATAAVAA